MAESSVGAHNGAMGQKLIWLSVFVGSTAGGYVPTLFGAELLSLWGVLGSTVGGIAGVFLGIKLEKWIV